jgi:hypothetical protein
MAVVTVRQSRRSVVEKYLYFVDAAGLGDTQRQARELISGPSWVTRLNSCPLTELNPGLWLAFLLDITPWGENLHLQGLSDSPLCRRCGVKEEISTHIHCECEALASLRHAYLGSSFLEPKDIKSMSLGAIRNFSKVTRLPWFDIWQKGPVN